MAAARTGIRAKTKSSASITLRTLATSASGGTKAGSTLACLRHFRMAIVGAIDSRPTAPKAATAVLGPDAAGGDVGRAGLVDQQTQVQQLQQRGVAAGQPVPVRGGPGGGPGVDSQESHQITTELEHRCHTPRAERPTPGRPARVQRSSSKAGANAFNKRLTGVKMALTINIWSVFTLRSQMTVKPLFLHRFGTLLACWILVGKCR